MNRLTGRQEQILDYIKDYLAETGFPPTRSEIAQEMGFRSPNAAEEHLRALARKGAIEMLPGTSRGIRLPISEQLGLPIVGQVAAGSAVSIRSYVRCGSALSALGLSFLGSCAKLSCLLHNFLRDRFLQRFRYEPPI